MPPTGGDRPGPHAAGDEPGVGSELNAALARAVVHVHREYVGRGPSRARAFFRDNVVVVVLRDWMTPAEHSLAADGRREAVRRIRDELDQSMREALVAVVEQLTGATVEAFLSDHDVDSDVAAEVFLLDRSVPGQLLLEKDRS